MTVLGVDLASAAAGAVVVLAAAVFALRIIARRSKRAVDDLAASFEKALAAQYQPVAARPGEGEDEDAVPAWESDRMNLTDAAEKTFDHLDEMNPADDGRPVNRRDFHNLVSAVVALGRVMSAQTTVTAEVVRTLEGIHGELVDPDDDEPGSHRGGQIDWVAFDEASRAMETRE